MPRQALGHGGPLGFLLVVEPGNLRILTRKTVKRAIGFRERGSRRQVLGSTVNPGRLRPVQHPFGRG